MNITIVTGFFLPVPPVRGGATEKIWYRLAREFVAAGHRVTFISRSWPDFPQRETIDGVSHIRVRGVHHTRSLPLNLWHDFWWGVRVSRVLPSADVVICNSPTLPAWLGFARPSAERVVAVVARMPKGQGRAYGRVDLILALSAAVATSLRAENPQLADRIVPFPFPIDWPLHARAGKRDPATSPITIGYIGRVHPEKGLRLLLSAAAQLVSRVDLPPWNLEIIGPVDVPAGGGGQEFYDALKHDFGKALGERLRFSGPEFDAEKLALRYGAIDIFCYPSLADRGETFGVAVAEAMAAGCAPVVSNLACFQELVHDNDTGLVFDQAASNAGEQLASALARLLSDAQLRCELGARAQQHSRRFDFTACAGTVLDDLQRVVVTK